MSSYEFYSISPEVYCFLYSTYKYYALIYYILSNIQKVAFESVPTPDVSLWLPQMLYSFFKELLGLRLVLFNSPV